MIEAASRRASVVRHLWPQSHVCRTRRKERDANWLQANQPPHETFQPEALRINRGAGRPWLKHLQPRSDTRWGEATHHQTFEAEARSRANQGATGVAGTLAGAK
jgi:hypothetical protein